MNSQPASTLRKFNPGLLQSDREIMEQFVVRRHELQLLLDDLRGNIGSPSCQHILVVGPRGRGKTMLLARIAAELRADADLAGSLLPVRFMEENPEIFGIADFWLETMFHLANEVDERDAALARELRETRAALMPRWREQINGAQARAAVLEAADRLERRLVLIVENLQSLFRDAHDDFGWQLRQVLQTDPQIILLASATSRFRELDDVSEPFFEMLRIMSLKPLDTDECGRLWEVVSGKPATRAEVRPLQILTGGNPRLLVMAAEFAQHRSLRRLMSELVVLVDEHTEYFRGHLEALAKTERRVYVAVIDLWQPSSASEVAARARVDIRVASTMLGRLVQRGAVVWQGLGRKRLYAAAEPLYSMYYKLRRERDEAAVVENLIRFMVACYGIGELSKFVTPLSTEAAASDVLRRGIRRALAARPVASDYAGDLKWDAIQQVSDTADLHSKMAALQRLLYDVRAAFEENQFKRIISLFKDHAVSGWPDLPDALADLLVGCAVYVQTYANWRLGNAHNVLEVSERSLALADSQDAMVQTWAAAILALRATAQLQLGRFRTAIATCDDVVRRFTSWQHGPLGDGGPEMQEWIVSALMTRGLACRSLGDREEEIASYDQVIDRFDSSDVSDSRRHVVVALASKCMAQAEIGLADETLAGYQRLEVVADSLASDGEGFREAPWAEWLKWHARGARALALAVQKDYRASSASFQAAYATFIADEATTREMLRLVSFLVAVGAPPRDLLAVLDSDPAKSANLRPLIVALHRRAGDRVRAPAEVEEVAVDVGRSFEDVSSLWRR